MNLTIRLVNMEDAKFLWETRNDPETRANSYTQQEITWSEHQRWLANKIADVNTRIYMMVDQNNAGVGQIRFEKNEELVAKVNLVISPIYRGQGFGKKMLKNAIPTACADLGVNRLLAYVKKANVASLRMFISCGFILNEDVEVNGSTSYKLMLYFKRDS